jgi:hypothetical protein
MNKEIEKMEITSERLDDYKIRITKTQEPVVTEHEYDINFLIQQKKDIQAQKDAFDAARDAEIKEVDMLLEHCFSHGLMEKPIEDIKPAPIEDIKPAPVIDIKPTPIVVKKKKAPVYKRLINWFKKLFKWQ